ncbi:MAG: hypothetical protein C0478_15015, partial [Planctomyces sp.]|nr:hypothetical protein [Planctomyces sp.]
IGLTVGSAMAGLPGALEVCGATGNPLPAKTVSFTPETKLTIDIGLAWLAGKQRADGGFGADRTYSRNVGVCALAGLALLSESGSLGKYGSAIEGCTTYLLSRSQSNGFIVEADVLTHAPLYGHGFSTTFLGQIYGVEPRREIRDGLRKAVDHILSRQQPNGGWRYTEDPADTDTSITTCQMMALLSARQAGIGVPSTALAKAVHFLKVCQNPDGGFRYRPTDPFESLFPRSAAAVATLCILCGHDDPAVVAGRKYLATAEQQPASGDPHAEYFYYGRFYAAQVQWQQGAAAWNHWYPAACHQLLARRTEKGHWSDPNIGDVYATAMALIVLQFPMGHIPLLTLP